MGYALTLAASDLKLFNKQHKHGTNRMDNNASVHMATTRRDWCPASSTSVCSHSLSRRGMMVPWQETNLEDLWEAESFTARFYLRQSEGFSYSGTLFEASRRDAREKSMFSVTDGHGREYILSVVLLKHIPRAFQSEAHGSSMSRSLAYP